MEKPIEAKPDCAICGAPAVWCQTRGEYRCSYHWVGLRRADLRALQREREFAIAESFHDQPGIDQLDPLPSPKLPLSWRITNLFGKLLMLWLLIIAVAIVLIGIGVIK